MKDPNHFLKYGFVVYLHGNQATYDDRVLARISYADVLFRRLRSEEQPVIAKLTEVVNGTRVASPVFKYESGRTGVDSYQSAYYLTDALMRKGMLPVFIPQTGEVKNLMPLLTKKQREDAKLVIKILQARYIQSRRRHPLRDFMVEEQPSLDSHSFTMSDSEILAIFGRLPGNNDAAKATMTVVNKAETELSYIHDNLTRHA